MMLKKIITVLIVCASSLVFANQWHDEADRWWNEAQKYKKARDYKNTIEYLKRAVIAERKNENPRSDDLIAQLNELGQVYEITGNYNKALHYYKLMLKACRKYGNSDQEALALNSIGQTYYNLNRFDEAIDSFNGSLAVSKKKGYKDKIVLVLNNMALAYRVMKDFNNARERYDEALKYAKEAGGSFNLAVITSNAGTMYYYQGEYDRALELYSQALDIDRRRGGDEFLSIDLSNIGSVYAAKGRYGEALNYLEKALEIDSKNKIERNIAARYYRIGDIYFMVGDNTRALEFYNKSLELNIKLNNKIHAASVQNSIGQLFDSMGKYEDALDCYIKALALNRDIEMKENIAVRLSDIGLLYETRERFGDAVDYIGKALMRDIMAEKKNRIAGNMSNIGRIMISLKRYDKALDYFQQSVALYRELGDTISIADDSKNCGIVYYNIKDYSRAIEYFTQSLRTIGKINDVKNKTNADVWNDAYRWLIASYIKAHNPQKAYEINESFCINKVYSMLSDVSPDQPIGAISCDRLKNKLDKKTGVVIIANIIWDNPFVIYIDSNVAVGFELDKAAAVKNLYNILGKDIESFIGKKKTDIIFNVSQKSRRDYYYIEFEKIINYYRSLLSKKYITSKEYDSQQIIGKVLYQFIFKKIETYLKGKETLVIQADGALSIVPFETMIMSDGRYLIEKFGVRYAFSQTCDDLYSEKIRSATSKIMLVLGGFNPPPQPAMKVIESTRHFDIIADGINRRIREKKSTRELYGFFGIIDMSALSSSQDEVEKLKARPYSSDSITGSQGTESSLLRLSVNGILGNYKIIHVLSKGIIVPEVPELSALLVSYDGKEGGEKDGILNARKIASLRLRSDHVHLASLCMPAAGYSRGEGIWNLCGAFMMAGTQGVSFSVWDLDEATRSLFMMKVYETVINKGMSFEKALTQVKRSFIQGKLEQIKLSQSKTEGNEEWRFSNPYFWGSFMYYGR